MKRFACIFAACSLAAAASTALAAQPAVMSDAQLDDVAAGVFTIIVSNSFNNWTINGTSGQPAGTLFQFNVLANVNAAIASGGSATAGQSVGPQTQALTSSLR
jgi:hypothetical protein